MFHCVAGMISVHVLVAFVLYFCFLPFLKKKSVVTGKNLFNSCSSLILTQLFAMLFYHTNVCCGVVFNSILQLEIVTFNYLIILCGGNRLQKWLSVTTTGCVWFVCVRENESVCMFMIVIYLVQKTVYQHEVLIML